MITADKQDDTEKTNPIIIYDLGSNDGNDIPYYLKKGDIVVAVEANPILSKQIESRFSKEIANGRLIVENFVLTTDTTGVEVPFYIHKTEDVRSKFPTPTPDEIDQYERVILPSLSVCDLIARNGSPHYIKIDIEHSDEPVLRALFKAGIYPPYISAESHTVGIFALLVADGGYDAFKLVDAATLSETYRLFPIKGLNGVERYSFPHHAAGPFGEDIIGDWMTADNFLRRLAYEELGWKDVHATNVHVADPLLYANPYPYVLKLIKRKGKSQLLRLLGKS